MKVVFLLLLFAAVAYATQEVQSQDHDEQLSRLPEVILDMINAIRNVARGRRGSGEELGEAIGKLVGVIIVASIQAQIAAGLIPG
jgi:hypothetical protein